MIVVAFLARLPAMINWVIAGGIQRATFLHKGEIDGPGAYPYSIVASPPFQTVKNQNQTFSSAQSIK